MIPIQINQAPSKACNGYNGNLNSWIYGLKGELAYTPEQMQDIWRMSKPDLHNSYKNRLIQEFNSIGHLAQHDTVNSSYYNLAQIDPGYISMLHCITEQMFHNGNVN
jgi:hypothetical protein